MAMQEEQLQRRKTEEEVFEKIREATNVELVPELIDDEKNTLLEDLLKQLERQGIGFDEWLERSGNTLEKAQKELEEQAKKRLTLRLGISTLIDEQEIEVTDEEMKKSIETLVSPLSPEERLKMAPAYAKGEQAYEQLKWQKRVDKLLEGMIQQ